jgi:hypothetical protein
VTTVDLDNTADPMAKQAEIDQAKKAVAGSVPLLPPQPDPLLELPRGLHRGDKWETTVEVKELTGEDEEALARFTKDMDFLDAVLAYGVARIGSLDLSELPVSERQGVLAQLLVGEREIIIVHIARVTFGDEKTYTFTCPDPQCETEWETTIVLSEDVKLPEMEEPYKIQRTFTTSKGAVLTGADQMENLRLAGASAAEINTNAISQLLIKVDGQTPLDPTAVARRLAMGDRARFLAAVSDAQPSIDLDFNIACPACKLERVVTLSLGDIFRP